LNASRVRGRPEACATGCCSLAHIGSAGFRRCLTRSPSTRWCRPLTWSSPVEGTFDVQSLRGKVVAGVAAAALARAKPTVVIAGQALVGRRDSMALGISGTYAVAEDPSQVAAALADPAGTLSRRTQRVATTWSPPSPLTYP